MSQVDTRVLDPQSVDAAIESRFSARAFLPQQPVAREMVEDILRVASRAPSGTNTQPWRVYILTGAARERLVAQVCAAHDAVRANAALAAAYGPDYDYYPSTWVSPYIDRRRENGWGLYGLLGIAKGEKDKMHEQQQRNFRFFDAPVGLIVTIERVMARGSLVDCGMFLQNVMVAARARGLHTCPQASWNDFAALVRPAVGASEQEMLVCGIALGYADEQASVNRFHTPREPVEGFARWVA